MSRTTENIVLFLVGFSLAITVTLGTFTRYVKPTLMPWLIAAAVLVMVLAATAMVRDIVNRRRDEHSPDVPHGHSHSSGVVWLLVLPVAALVVVPAPALGVSDAPSSTAAVSKPFRHAFEPLPAGRTVDLTLTEVEKRAENDTAATLNGRLLTVVGFTITKNAGKDAGRDANKDVGTDLGRFYIICCAADARLRRLHLTGPAAAVAAGQPDGTWLSVEGFVVLDGSSVPNLAVSTVAVIPAPTDPYEYPS